MSTGQPRNGMTRACASDRAATIAGALAGAIAALVMASPAAATFAGRNGMIAFQADTGTGSQIYTVRPNGHGLRQLTHVDGEALRPDVSPDGRRIVFELDTADSANVAFMNADGSQVVAVPAPGGFEGDPSFTPDGARVVFERVDPVTADDAIWSMNLDGGDRRRIGSGPAGAIDPNVSPDGHTVSFVSLDGLQFGQALASSGLDGSHQRLLTPFTLDVAIKQDWAPDARRLAFSDNADIPERSANVATVRPDGSGLRYLTHFSGGQQRAYVGSYAPNGRWIVYRLEDHGEFALMRMRPDGSDVRTILPLSTFRPRFIDWGARTPDEADASVGDS